MLAQGSRGKPAEWPKGAPAPRLACCGRAASHRPSPVPCPQPGVRRGLCVCRQQDLRCGEGRHRAACCLPGWRHPCPACPCLPPPTAPARPAPAPPRSPLLQCGGECATCAAPGGACLSCFSGEPDADGVCPAAKPAPPCDVDGCELCAKDDAKKCELCETRTKTGFYSLVNGACAFTPFKL